MKKTCLWQTTLIIFCYLIIFCRCQDKNNAPQTPSIPSGPSYGMINTTYHFSSQTTDIDDDSISFRFDWGNGDTSYWSYFVASGESIVLSNSWTTADTYYIRAQARDKKMHISDWSDSKQVIISSNRLPNSPAFITGPSNGFVNIFYSYSTSAYDPDGDSVAIQFDWNNGSISNWTDFIPNYQIITLRNLWTNSGTYSLRARTKDIDGAISSWSYGYQVTINQSGAPFPNYVMANVPVGSNPQGLAILPNSNFIYVANSTSNNISVINAQNNTIDTTIPVGINPWGVVALASGEYIYVTNEGSNTVSVIRTSDNTVVNNISVGNGPWGITAHPSGNFVYVANANNNSLSVIRTSDNIVVATVSVGDYPWALAITPNGDYIYVTNNLSNSVSVIRTSDNTVIATINLSASPHGIVATNNDYVYVVNGNNISVISTMNNTVIQTFEVGNNPEGVCALPAGDYLYVVNQGSNNVSVVHTLTNQVIGLITVGSSPCCAVSSPDGQKVYVTNSLSNTVSVISR